MNLLAHKWGRALTVFAFYFTEGAPIGFIWWAMPAMLRREGVEVDQITAFTALLTLPWVLKFLWAPLVDIFRSARFGYTSWIGWSQLMMCVSLLPLVFTPLSGNLFWWTVLLLLHSFCAATQDVSVDALVINSVPKHEKGILNGYMLAGMLSGRSLFGGAALVFVPVIGLPFTLLMMIAVIVCVMILLFFIREPETAVSEKIQLLSFKSNLLKTFRSRQTWLVIVFALTSAAAFEATGGMSGVFLTDRGLSMQTVGYFFGLPVLGSMLLGGFAGGFLSDRLSRRRAVVLFLLGVVVFCGLIGTLALLDPGLSAFVWMALFGALYFFTGMFTAASYALYMDASNPRIGATQFSTFMAATNGCEAWVVWSAGIIAATQGYGIAFLAMCSVSLLSIVFLYKVRT